MYRSGVTRPTYLVEKSILVGTSCVSANRADCDVDSGGQGRRYESQEGEAQRNHVEDERGVPKVVRNEGTSHNGDDEKTYRGK